MSADIDIAIAEDLHARRAAARIVIKENGPAIPTWQKNDATAPTAENGWSTCVRNQCGTICGGRSAECRLASLPEEDCAAIINDRAVSRGRSCIKICLSSRPR